LPRTRDMRSLYAKARVVLAPSQYDETFGRIAPEAHASGIPVLASRRAGLPEAVGPGGVLIDPGAPIASWADALRKMWSDAAYHRQLSEAALAYSRRPELDFGLQLDRFIALLETAIASPRSASADPVAV
jgi:glycosyltransferase involved in cell wall biosynthesis